MAILDLVYQESLQKHSQQHHQQQQQVDCNRLVGYWQDGSWYWHWRCIGWASQATVGVPRPYAGTWCLCLCANESKCCMLQTDWSWSCQPFAAACWCVLPWQRWSLFVITMLTASQSLEWHDFATGCNAWASFSVKLLASRHQSMLQLVAPQACR